MGGCNGDDRGADLPGVQPTDDPTVVVEPMGTVIPTSSSTPQLQVDEPTPTPTVVETVPPVPTPEDTPPPAPEPEPPEEVPEVVAQPASGCTQEIICAYSWNCGTAMRVVGCETGQTYDPNVVGDEKEKGCFQIHPIHWGKSYCNPDFLFDPAYNAECAWQIYAVEGQGWWPWSCY